MSSAVAVGVFDGVHLGHRALLEHAVRRARERSVRCVVLSFDPHPDVVLSKGQFHIPAPLTPLPEKRARLLEMGVDELKVLPFTRELAALSPEEFVDWHLGPHVPFLLVVGEGFALGRGRSGNVGRLREIGADRGFTVDVVPLVDREGAPVSSTRIRGLLGQGKVAEVEPLLGRPYGLTAMVVRGEGIGATLGYPTANLRLHDEKFLPGDGIYAVRVRWGGDPAWRPGAMSIGVRPTFEGRVRTLEVYVLDWRGDLVGREMEVEFVDWLRPELKFENAAALVAAMDRDVAETRRRLGLRPGPVGA
ncbi:MAG TPA: bifunctional riboflavin kinase/FAD synthetase [Candidatus Eisenbacteria bacterium]|jgi:riboflavin kinase/FMN adenylyltransferase